MHEIPVPKKPFDILCAQFKNVDEVMKTKEWAEIFSNYYDFDKAELEIPTDETKEEVEIYDSEKQVQEIIKCVNSFPYFCHKYVKITHPMRGLLPFRLFKYQRRVVKEYEKHRFNILSKFRQGGLTTVSVLWALWKCMFSTDQQIMVLSKTDREAIAAGEIVKRALEYMPKWMLPRMGKSNEHEKQFLDTGSNLWFYTPEAARGKSITILIIDEAAFIADMDKHWKAMYPVISTGGACIVVSTVNGIGNWYEETYREAEAGKNAFNVIELDYWEHPEYNNPKWVRETKSNLGEKGWQQEVLRSFLGSGETYIPSKIITELDISVKDNRPSRILFSKWANLNEKNEEDWEKGALWIWREPIDGHEYIIGADCAEGVGEHTDNNCFQILDIATLEQVGEFYSNTIPPHIFSQVLNEIGIYYNNALIVIESQNQGSAVVSNLQHNLAYENLYFEPKGRQETAGVKTGKQSRPLFLETLQNRLLNNCVRINSKRFVYELKTFIFNASTKRAEAQRGKHDDAIMSMAIALYIRDSQVRAVPVGASQENDMVKIFKTDIYEEIRQEIKRGAPEDWIEEDTDPIFDPNDESVMTGVSFDIRRKNNNLLREFGWIWIISASIWMVFFADTLC